MTEKGAARLDKVLSLVWFTFRWTKRLSLLAILFYAVAREVRKFETNATKIYLKELNK